MSSCPVRRISTLRFGCGRREKMAAGLTMVLFFLLFIMQGMAAGSPGARVLGWKEMALGTVGDLGDVPTGKASLSPLSPPAFPILALYPRCVPPASFPWEPPALPPPSWG